MAIRSKFSVLLLAASLTACGGGSSPPTPGAAEPPASAPPAGCDGSCATANSFLTSAEVGRIIAQAVNEAAAINQPATIAVSDRVGNILGVFVMDGAPRFAAIDGGRGIQGGLEGVDAVPSELAAIAKAITGAYLSSEGNAFTTRTASQIVQQNFNPGEFNQPGGPLFGVQFSQLPCSDLNRRFGVHGTIGPKRSPLGLSADPGGMPLYKEGVPVGAIGVMADGIYGLDIVISDRDVNPDELIAIAGSFGFAAPTDRQGDRITVDGKTFRFSDVDANDLTSDPASAPSFAATNGSMGDLFTVPAYFDGQLLDGVAFGQPESGIRPAGPFLNGLDAFVLVDDDNNNRYPPRAGTDGGAALTEEEVTELLRQALDVANRARAQIRRPLSSQARVTVSIVDSNGVILALARTRDAPVFGTDVSLQKARTAAFYSGDFAADDLAAAPNTTYVDVTPIDDNTVDIAFGETIVMFDYVVALREFLGLPNALADGAFAFSDRAGGNLSRPFFPDGVEGTPHGPFSKAFNFWSPFKVGSQLDLVYNSLASHLVFYYGAIGILDPPLVTEDLPFNCTTLDRLANGIQIFPGSVPIYRDGTLVGGIGISGDGVDQDDMIAFLGLHNAGEVLGTINNAPPAIRADQLTPMGTRLRYIQCPQAPFLDSDEQNVCQGK